MLLKINPDNPQQRLLDRVVDLLKAGGIIAYPTDTYYGIGCDIMNKKSIEKIAGLYEDEGYVSGLAEGYRDDQGSHHHGHRGGNDQVAVDPPPAHRPNRRLATPLQVVEGAVQVAGVAAIAAGPGLRWPHRVAPVERELEVREGRVALQLGAEAVAVLVVPE